MKVISFLCCDLQNLIYISGLVQYIVLQKLRKNLRNVMAEKILQDLERASQLVLVKNEFFHGSLESF